MSKIRDFVRSEMTFFIALIAAGISCFFVKPDTEYLGYIDFRTLALLYCLMVVVSGLRSAGIFARLSHNLCRKAGTVRKLSVLLVLMSFFSAMFVTNDVALLTFVPLTVAVLGLCHQEKQLIWVVVLQTVAANLGSMLTPVGNPQNLFIYSYYDLNVADFIAVTGPVWLVSLSAVILLCIPVSKEDVEVSLGETPILNTRRLVLYSVLFAACLTVVFRLIQWPVLLVLMIAVLLILDRKMLLKVDFVLLLTFVCFFVFSGNLARVPAVNTFLRAALSGRELLVGAAASQVISNVPAALLLSGFTDNAHSLLLGVNIGGLGTPVASLASLISLKLYSHADGARTGPYLRTFSIINFALLAFLLIFASVLS